MQIHDLRSFIAATEETNLTRLAESLHMSQPALSRALRRVETSVGVELFDRVGRSIAPNRHGREFAERVRAALDGLTLGMEEVRASADPERGEIRLAFLHTLGSWLIPELLGAYRQEHPQTRFQLAQGSAGATLAQLIAGQHDLLLTGARPEHPQLAWLSLFDQPLVLVVPPGHQLARRGRVWLKEVAQEPFIALSPDTGLRARVDQLCRDAGFRPQVAFESEEVETLRGLVSAGLGVALLPDSPGAPASPPKLDLRDAGAERTIGLVFHHERYRSPAVVAFSEFIVTHVVGDAMPGLGSAH